MDTHTIESEHASLSISHDLRAPLRVVEGFTRILKEDYGPSLDRVANDHLERVLAATTRMGKMIDALLGLAQISSQPLVRQSVNLSQLAEFILEDLRHQQADRLATVHVQGGIVRHGDPTLLRMLMENLLGNAWKYTGKRDHTRIEVSERVMPDGRVACCIHDNGAGFNPDLAPRLFLPFQRLHSISDFPGHGIGLATVKRIVQRHGGEVWASCNAEEGAEFCFTLAERVADRAGPAH